MSKLTSRQKQAIATKLKITEVATELFRSNKFESVKIQDICDAAGISIGAFYHHFKSKSEIIDIGYEQIDLLFQEQYEYKAFESNVESIKYLLGEVGSFLQELGWFFMSEAYKYLISYNPKYTFCTDRFVYSQVLTSVQLGVQNCELKCIDISELELSNTIMRVLRGDIIDWFLREGNYDLKDKILYDFNLIITNFIH
jgi:AcrR family transcriptional regulator